ncbi:PREDICTED: transcription factor MYB39-like [Nelumbo nucifera]|uniref:Transcription factor MYB39-like n=2 Tax=Nelumbo nucifera TaxID=4432 RepID=A0A1U7YPZ2_NELNU|nr:PREDICTED: transcription factor MYB39-like [Nelumbo nucifera]DAD17829.1 TPA_asm: hypothetical protein HUJ06_019292 [Nelumbo nucifera]
MARSPCCDDSGLKKGPWTPEEDQKLIEYIQKHGHGSWRALPRLAGLNRCGKSCRLRWTNYLRPDIRRGKFSDEEEQIIINLHSVLGNKWSAIANQLPGRTDNEIKNYWNTHIRKKLLQMGIDPVTHRPRTDLNLLANLPQFLAVANLNNLMGSWDNSLRLQAEAAQLARSQLFQNLLQANMNTPTPPNSNPFNLLRSASFQGQNFAEHAGSNAQLEGLLSNLLGPGPDDHHTHHMPSTTSTNLGIQEPSNVNDYNQILDSSVYLGGFGSTLCDSNGSSISDQNLISSSYDISALDIIPPLVSVDPKMEAKSTPSTSTTFDAWGELNLDCEPTNYWGDMIDQSSSGAWPLISS